MNTFLFSRIQRICQSAFTQVKQSKQLQLAMVTLGVGWLSFLLGITSLIYAFLPAADTKTIASKVVPNQELPNAIDKKVASQSSQVVVDVSGAVRNPGLYQLPQNSRIFDALDLAGGLISSADINLIQQQVNLAERIVEGEKIYFPVIQSDGVGTSQKNPSSSFRNSENLNGSTHLISINSAAENDLDSLPGIGPSFAAKIISGRPYQNLNDLVTKTILNQNLFEKIKKLIKI